MNNNDSSERVWPTAAWDVHASGLPQLDSPLMALLLENISTRVAVLGVDRRYRYVNQEALRFMGLPAEQVIGRPMSEILDAGVLARVAPLVDRAFAGETLRRNAWADYAKQGRRFREQWYVPYRPAGAADGPVQCVVICGLDHTEQRLNELALEQQRAALSTSEALKSAIVDHALTALISTDADSRIVEFNPKAQAMLGHRRADVLGRRIGDVLMPARHHQAHEDDLQRLQSGAAPQRLGQRVETRALRADGSEFPMEMVLWRTDVEGAVFYTAMINDLSERHRARQQIERQREVLRQSEKLSAMGSLLAGVSHELNNPLAIAMGRAGLLEEKCADQPELLDDARRIRAAVERCSRIVRTFLNMARSRPMQRQRMSLNDAVHAAVDMLGYTLRSHQIDLQLQLDADLPAVDADSDQIGQVVLNLLVNAQQALAAQPGPHWLRVSTGAAGDTPASTSAGAGLAVPPHVWLRVADNGPGIASAARARVFEPFFTTKEEGVGTGMGLTVSRRLAREHGGDLGLEDDAATPGAVFCLRLPLQAVTSEGQGLAPPSPEALPVALAADAQDAPPPRVLVVDDEAELAHVMRDMLESAGYDVATAESGAVALALLDTARFDAVVCDLRMPDMDGATMWRRVGEQDIAMAGRFIFITGDTLSPDAQAFLQLAGCDALEKPFTKADLLHRLQALRARSAATVGD
jgi:PAS domain S-box-containing protein